MTTSQVAPDAGTGARCQVCWLGQDVDYVAAWDLQRRLWRARVGDPAKRSARLEKAERIQLHFAPVWETRPLRWAWGLLGRAAGLWCR